MASTAPQQRSPRVRQRLRGLDRLHPGLGLAVGALVGAAAGAVLLAGLPLPAAAAGFALLLAVGAALAVSGEAVAVPLPAPPAHPGAAAGEAPPEEQRQEGPPPQGEPQAAPHPALDPLALVAIPAGRFRMGSPEDEPERSRAEGPVHPVAVPAFRCMRYPVTRRLYARVMGEDPGWPGGEADDRPVNNVTWFDAVEFCNRLSEREGLRPCYEREGDEVRWDRTADGYRLPIEAEWEYACRAGTATPWSCGSDAAELGRYAWYDQNAEREPRPVGAKLPNPWGLHDLHGNVWEWCWDRFGPYPEGEQNDPTGPEEGVGRVLRGGSFAVPARDLRSAFRFGVEPEFRDRGIGFRCVRGSRRQP